MNRRVLVLVALLGVSVSLACQDILQIGPVPAATDDGGTDDAADSSAPKCDPAAPFGTPTAVPGLASDGVALIRLSPDELTAFICRSEAFVNAPADLFIATRPLSSAAFGSELQIATDQRACAVTTTADNLTLVWNEQDPPDGQALAPTHLYMTKRGSVASTFNLLDGGKRIAEPNGSTSTTAPFLSADGAELYYTSIDGKNALSSFQASADSGYGNGSAIPGISGGAYELIVSPNGLIAYFVGPNGLEVATRDSRSSPFGSATSVSVVDAGKNVNVAPVLVSDDACKFYYEAFDSNMPSDGNFSFRTTLYVVTKKP